MTTAVSIINVHLCLNAGLSRYSKNTGAAGAQSDCVFTVMREQVFSFHLLVSLRP